MKFALEEENIDVLIRATNGEELTSADRLRLSVWIRMSFRAAENIFYQHRVGTFDDGEFEGARKFHGRQLSNARSREWWEEYKDEFSPEFRKEVELIYQEDNP